MIDMPAIGDRVRLRNAVIEHACEDHPALLYASAKAIVIVRRIVPSSTWPIKVSHEDVTDSDFGVKLTEIEKP